MKAVSYVYRWIGPVSLIRKFTIRFCPSVRRLIAVFHQVQFYFNHKLFVKRQPGASCYGHGRGYGRRTLLESSRLRALDYCMGLMAKQYGLVG